MGGRPHPGRDHGREHRHRDFYDRDPGVRDPQAPLDPAALAPYPSTSSIETVDFTDAVLEIGDRGVGYLRSRRNNYLPDRNDVQVPAPLIARYRLRPGLHLAGPVVRGDGRSGPRLLDVAAANGRPAADFPSVVPLERQVPIDPTERFIFSTTSDSMSPRVVDLFAPIGKGQRSMIVSPPRAGKTMLLQALAAGLATNHPDVRIKVLLVDERPEEVTEMRRTIRGEVIASSNDMDADSHIRIADLVLEESRREAELGADVVIFLDSLTRLGRAHNRETRTSGRTLSGGLDARALEEPKRIFGAARNLEGGGSLTIIATALIETGSRMDEVIFEEFKGTGNMELVLDRKLADRRVWPAIDLTKSGTRKEEKLLPPGDLKKIYAIRRILADLDPLSAMQKLLEQLSRCKSNAEFLANIPG
jgi:transcription termination factor Rho